MPEGDVPPRESEAWLRRLKSSEGDSMTALSYPFTPWASVSQGHFSKSSAQVGRLFHELGRYMHGWHRFGIITTTSWVLSSRYQTAVQRQSSNSYQLTPSRCFLGSKSRQASPREIIKQAAARSSDREHD
jgi:hypothetical protein